MNRHSGSHQPFQGAQHRPQSSYNGPMPIPSQPNGQTRERNGSMNGNHMGKSPPAVNGKNTKHVPCKFFRQGQCQAGATCPFMHTLDPMQHQAPCKYFMKGNCKFGAKCALAHYLPDGRRVTKADLDPISRPIDGYGRNVVPRDPPSFSHEAQQNDTYYPPNNNIQGLDMPFLDDEEYGAPADNRYMNAFQNGNRYDMPVGSPPTSQFGSPPADIQQPRRWPSALDAPLPRSFTGTSIPNYVTKGHISGSVPDKLGLGSPPGSSLQNANGASARDKLSIEPAQTSNPRPTPLGASPAHAETSLNGRLMHSQRHALSSRTQVSSSVPVQNFDSRFGLETDLPYLPSDLHEEILTPGEKMRRLSRADQETGGSFRDAAEGLAIPRRSSNAVGSPPAAGSPSRFRAIFEEQQREKSSNVGPVGSPLRESWMLDGNSSISHRQGMQMSGISQAMARMELNRTDSTESNGLRASNIRSGFNRQISSPGLTSQRIDEEGDPSTFFPMDNDEGSRRGAAAWTDSQSVNSRRVSEDNAGPRGVAFNSINRPIFGFHG